jgi:hypothetical protein
VPRACDHSPSSPAQTAKPSAPIVARGHQQAGGGRGRSALVAEDQHGGGGSDGRPDGQLAERHHGDEHRDCVEERRVDADRVQQEPVAHDLASAASTAKFGSSAAISVGTCGRTFERDRGSAKIRDAAPSCPLSRLPNTCALEARNSTQRVTRPP